MAPTRRPPRPIKESKKKSKVPTYDSFEEALDAGVVQEEKGERYRTGEKAMRFYEEARKLYELAISFDSAAFEGHYNLARTLFTLANNFLLPPSSLQLLQSSIASYKRALACTDDLQLRCDTQFNLAESLLSLADIVEDGQGGGDAAAVEGWRKDAADLLLETSRMQEGLLAEQDGNGEAEPEAGETMDEDEPVVEAEGDEADDAGKEGDAPRAWEQTVTTPSVLLDTLLLFVSTLVLLPSTFTIISTINDALQRSNQLAERIRNYSRRDLDVLIAHANFQLHRIKSDPTLSITDQSDPTLVVDEAKRTIATLDSSWAAVKDTPIGNEGLEKETKVGLICALGDAQSLLAQILSQYHSLNPSTAPAAATQIWNLLSASTQASATALAILTPPPSPFPSSVALDPSSSTVLLTLSSLSLARAKLSFPPFSLPAAEKNRPQLLTNALTYARRAAEASNTSLHAVLPPFPSVAAYSTKPKVVDGGWEAESTGRDVIMTFLRVLFYQGGQEAVVRQVIGKVKGRLEAGDVERFAAGLVDEEPEVSAEEQAFWQEVLLSI